MTNTELLKKAIKESGLKMEYLAAALGISRTSFSMKVNNTSSFKVPEMYKLCEVLDVKEKEAKTIFFTQ